MSGEEQQSDQAERDRLKGAHEVDEPTLYCPVCSQRLVALKCKLICEKCGYYMSCADYY
jgi:hypothetical protein